jgi:hypothetical protein
MVDPMKFEEILRMPPPRNIHQFQGLQGKANFLSQFIVNYANLTKGFMRLLKKDTSFIWDDQAQESLDALKKTLVSTPMLKPLEYIRDYLLYITASEGMVGMVIFHEDDELHENIVYYLSRNLVGIELKYSHVEKLAFVVVHAVQYVLTRCIIGGKYNKWIIILQEIDLDFSLAKSKKSLVFS